MQTTQKGRTWVSQKIPRGQSGRSSCGTGGGPHAQSQIINLVNGVVTVALRPRTPPVIRATRAGPSSMNGFKRTPVASRSTASLPVRAQFTSAARTGQALLFLPREGSPAGDWFAREKLAAQVVDLQRRLPFQFLASLLPVRRGWFANHALPTGLGA